MREILHRQIPREIFQGIKNVGTLLKDQVVCAARNATGEGIKQLINISILFCKKKKTLFVSRKNSFFQPTKNLNTIDFLVTRNRNMCQNVFLPGSTSLWQNRAAPICGFLFLLSDFTFQLFYAFCQNYFFEVNETTQEMCTAQN